MCRWFGQSPQSTVEHSFVSDLFFNGLWFRVLTVLDQFTKERLCTQADWRQTGKKVVGKRSECWRKLKFAMVKCVGHIARGTAAHALIALLGPI
jgi:hypothetical protein